MNILLLGSGGREHALAWKLAQSRLCTKLFAAPGNPGIAQHAELVALDAADHAAVLQFCADQRIGLVVVGPEAPLVDGLTDALRAAGVPVFGPSQAAAQLEGSKAFTKELCERHDIPTAGFVRVASAAEGLAALDRFGIPVVIKADGLAAGKGVTVAMTRAEAEEAVADIFSGKFGAAGAEAVVEEFLEGEEASFFAITDGHTIVPFGSAQDHKRVGDGDTGPNTGGMDARFGDPECQVLMLRLESDLGELLLAVAEGKLATLQAPRLSPDTALTVVMAAQGYPGTPKKGGAIRGLDAAEATGAKVFHAGTALTDGQLISTGGRVLNVTARGASATEAQARAYAAVDAVDFADGFCRRDIGYREVAREAQG